MENRLNILGTGVDTLTMDEAVDFLVSACDGESFTSVYTPNSEILLHAYKNADYCAVLNRGGLITADGIGVIYASKILGRALPERVSGFDLANKLLQKSAQKNKTLYLFGGKPGVAERAAKKIEELYPGINIVGTQDGYFDAEKEKAIIQAEQELEVAKKQAEAQLEKAKKEAEATEVKAEAEANALQIIQEAWNSIPTEVREVMLQEMAIENWNGELPDTMVGSDFLEWLMGAIK